ncbi:MAG: ABC transporter ATP-binding protein/permease [Gammaproteobacteria bacterium]|nr:ABC transporter ATP-binding protein/permease [Gammaproteobacteria bacterium]
MNQRLAAYHFLLNHLRPFRGLIFLSLGLGSLSALLSGVGISLVVPVFVLLWQGESGAVATPAVVQRLVAFVEASLPGEAPVALVTAILAVFVLRSVIRLFHAGISHNITYRVAQRLRRQVMERILHADLIFHTQQHASDHFTRVSPEVTRAAQAAGQGVLGLEKALTAAVLAALLFAFSWKITIVAAVLFALVATVNGLHVARIRKYGIRFYDASIVFSRGIFEAIAGIRLIKSMQREAVEVERLDQLSDSRERSLYEYNVHHAALGPINDVLGMIGLLALAFIARALLGSEVQSLSATALVYLVVLLYLVPELIELNRIRSTVVHTEAGLKALTSFVSKEAIPAVPSGPRRYAGLTREIVFENVSYTYQDRAQAALANVSFTIPRGAVVCLVGPSGAGKSTAADLLVRFMDPQEGRILVDGLDLRDIELSSWRAALSVVSQDTFLFHDTVYRNVAYANPTATRDEVIEVLHRAHAFEFIRQFPNGIDTVVGDRGARLSGGERQRIAIARALLRNPDILVMDEATNALDPVLDQNLQDALRTLLKGRTVLFIAHRLSSVRASDHVIVLQHGHIVEQGSPECLLREGRYFYKLHEAFTAAGSA